MTPARKPDKFAASPPPAFSQQAPSSGPTVIEVDGEDELAEIMNANQLLRTTAPPGTRAVIYLRVSSKDQVNTDYDPEGISIPAQRVACRRKADQLGLTIVGEYVEAGRSATEMEKRVAFQQMLQRVRGEKDVDYVIVHKLNRFARNRIDDALVMAELQKRGVTLISATEQIDASPVGQLMHGILAAFNEYRSREDGADIAYKMGQKAKNGGTLGKAPLGYLNVTEMFEGRKVNTIVIDPERAPFIKLAFELYATGEFTMDDIVDELSVRGLTTRPTVSRPPGPVSTSKMSRLLRDPYYVGQITYQGEAFDGRHLALIDRDLFDQVQSMLEQSGRAGERRRIYEQYLKGSVFCGECQLERGIPNNRLVIQRAVGRNKDEYFYFFCIGRHHGHCDSRHIPVHEVEEAVIAHYRSVQLDADFIEWVKRAIDNVLSDRQAVQAQLRNQLKTRLQQLSVKADNLVDLVAEGGLASSKAVARIREIDEQKRQVELQLGSIEDDLVDGATYIRGWLELLSDPYELYLNASDEMRRRLNQAIFIRMWIIDLNRAESELSEPAQMLIEAQMAWQSARFEQAPLQTPRPPTKNEEAPGTPGASSYIDHVNVWNKRSLVDLRGFEPLTSSMRTRRATNCATGPETS